jgi:hypothetical protein
MSTVTEKAGMWEKLSLERMERLGLCGDPLGYVDGMDLYEAMDDNPIKWADPSGLDHYDIVIGDTDKGKDGKGFNPDNTANLPDLRSVIIQIQARLKGIKLKPGDSVTLTLVGHGVRPPEGEDLSKYGRYVDPVTPDPNYKPTTVITQGGKQIVDPLATAKELGIDNNGKMNDATIEFYREIRDMNLPDLVIVLYGCNTATGGLGKAMLEQVGAITGAKEVGGYTDEIPVERTTQSQRATPLYTSVGHQAPAATHPAAVQIDIPVVSATPSTTTSGPGTRP